MGPTPLRAVAARAVAALRVVAARGGVTRKVYQATVAHRLFAHVLLFGLASYLYSLYNLVHNSKTHCTLASALGGVQVGARLGSTS